MAKDEDDLEDWRASFLRAGRQLYTVVIYSALYPMSSLSMWHHIYLPNVSVLPRFPFLHPVALVS